MSPRSGCSAPGWGERGVAQATQMMDGVVARAAEQKQLMTKLKLDTHTHTQIWCVFPSSSVCVHLTQRINLPLNALHS